VSALGAVSDAHAAMAPSAARHVSASSDRRSERAIPHLAIVCRGYGEATRRCMSSDSSPRGCNDHTIAHGAVEFA
ncbi:MAG TPA: hypothetical protein VFO28_14980, partial [Burkholderiaceae bacterium]|nr:hypothetical protein [Burkholderiaceae bacterium]